jgi:hypothetical protein
LRRSRWRPTSSLFRWRQGGADGALARLDGPLDGLLARLADQGELKDEIGRAAVVHVDDKLGLRV